MSATKHELTIDEIMEWVIDQSKHRPIFVGVEVMWDLKLVNEIKRLRKLLEKNNVSY